MQDEQKKKENEEVKPTETVNNNDRVSNVGNPQEGWKGLPTSSNTQTRDSLPNNIAGFEEAGSLLIAQILENNKSGGNCLPFGGRTAILDVPKAIRRDSDSLNSCARKTISSLGTDVTLDSFSNKTSISTDFYETSKV